MNYDPEGAVFDPGPPEAPRDIVSRAINAALFNRRTFHEIQEDPGTTSQVRWLVVVAAIAAVIGSIKDPSEAIINGVLVVTGWLIYAHVAWFLRSFLFDSIHSEASRPEMLRVVGIAYGPSLLRVFGIIPVVGGIIWAVVTIWMLVAIVFGLKTTLAYENYWPPVGIIVLGAVVNSILSLIVFGIADLVMTGR